MPVSPIRKNQADHALTVLGQFRKLTEVVLEAAQEDARNAFLELGKEDAPDKFLYASQVVGACQQILKAESPETMNCADQEIVFRAIQAFI